jgi:multidrug efflux system membrane fusion protein
VRRALRSPVAAALLLSLALAGWLASRPLERWLRGGGDVPAATASLPAAASAAPTAPPRASVRVVESAAAPVTPELVINGRTEPARAVSLKAETGGRVVATPVPEGALVEAGAVLVRLDERDRRSRVAEMEARLEQRDLAYEAARRLGERQFQARTAVAEARAGLEAARAALHEARLDLERTEPRAPFAAVLEARAVEVGDYAEPGDEVARLVERDPFLVVGDAPETLAGRFRAGQEGRAALADGTEVLGRVRFVAGVADPGTRTFRVELEVPNPQGAIRAGMSARIVVPEPAVAAHRVSAAALVLGDDGSVGIQAVEGAGEAGVVRFHEARIVKAGADAVWLAGLPERLRVVTTGQGFVRAGQAVRVQAEPGAAAPGGGGGGGADPDAAVAAVRGGGSGS